MLHNMQSLKVYRVKYHHTSRMYYVSPNIKLCKVLSGSGIWQIGTKVSEIREKDIIILNNQKKRMFHSVSESQGLEMLIIEFEPTLLLPHFQALFFNRDDHYGWVISNHTQMNALFEEIEWEEINKKYYYKMIQEAKVIELLTLIGREYQLSEEDNIRVNGLMYQILTYIDKEFTTDICLKTFAATLHMSESNFSRYFLKYMGVGFAQYIMQKRIAHAINMLQSTEKTVLEIALECGYNNTASFYKSFKKITHMTPSDFRNNNGENYI